MRRLLAAIVVAIALTLVACAGTDPAQSHPAAMAVTALLKARASRSTEVRAYRPYVSESSVATALAAVASQPATHSPTPEWLVPYVSSVSTSTVTTATADVVVVWVQSKVFPGWPAATDFKVERHGGSWVVVDASQIPSGALPKHLATVKAEPFR